MPLRHASLRCWGWRYGTPPQKPPPLPNPLPYPSLEGGGFGFAHPTPCLSSPYVGVGGGIGGEECLRVLLFGGWVFLLGGGSGGSSWWPSAQLEPLDASLLQQKPNVNAVATLEKVIEIQSESLGGTWGSPGGGEHRGAALTLGGGGTWRGAMGDRKQGGGMTTHRGPQGCPWSHWVVRGGPYPLGGVFAHWGGSWSYSGHGGPRLCPHMCPLGCPRMGVLGVLGSVLPMGGSPQVCPQHWKVLPPLPRAVPAYGGPSSGGGHRLVPWGFLGSSELPFPLRFPSSSPPSCPPPYGKWETPGLFLEWGSWLGVGGGSSRLSF